jgi:hypothetical protein
LPTRHGSDVRTVLDTKNGPEDAIAMLSAWRDTKPTLGLALIDPQESNALTKALVQTLGDGLTVSLDLQIITADAIEELQNHGLSMHDESYLGSQLWALDTSKGPSRLLLHDLDLCEPKVRDWALHLLGTHVWGQIGDPLPAHTLIVSRSRTFDRTATPESMLRRIIWVNVAT